MMLDIIHIYVEVIDLKQDLGYTEDIAKYKKERKHFQYTMLRMFLEVTQFRTTKNNFLNHKKRKYK